MKQFYLVSAAFAGSCALFYIFYKTRKNKDLDKCKQKSSVGVEADKDKLTDVNSVSGNCRDKNNLSKCSIANNTDEDKNVCNKSSNSSDDPARLLTDNKNNESLCVEGELSAQLEMTDSAEINAPDMLTTSKVSHESDDRSCSTLLQVQSTPQEVSVIANDHQSKDSSSFEHSDVVNDNTDTKVDNFTITEDSIIKTTVEQITTELLPIHMEKCDVHKVNTSTSFDLDDMETPISCTKSPGNRSFTDVNINVSSGNSEYLNQHNISYTDKSTQNANTEEKKSSGCDIMNQVSNCNGNLSESICTFSDVHTKKTGNTFTVNDNFTNFNLNAHKTPTKENNDNDTSGNSESNNINSTNTKDSLPTNSPIDNKVVKTSDMSNENCNGTSDLEKDVSSLSDSLSQISQSLDSGEGSIEVEPETLFSSLAFPIQIQDQPIWYQFEIGQELVGRLIGKKGAFVKKIKARTGTSVIIQNHPNKRLKLCSLQGSKTDICHALSMVREHFPIEVYTNLTLNQVNSDTSSINLKTPQFNKDHHKVSLPSGVLVEARVSSVSSTAEIWLQQPLHPSYSALPRLMECLNKNYGTTGMLTPGLPQPICEGVVCVGKVNDQWMRCLILMSQPPNCLVSLLDVGGTLLLPSSSLRQIRTDYMSLPFQADQCYLTGVQPVAEYWDEEGRVALEELVHGKMVYANVVAYTEEGIPCVNLYLRQYSTFVNLNQKLVELGHARYMGEDVSLEMS